MAEENKVKNQIFANITLEDGEIDIKSNISGEVLINFLIKVTGFVSDDFMLALIDEKEKEEEKEEE
jgi:hypothetical protein